MRKLILIAFLFISSISNAGTFDAQDCLFNWAEKTYPQFFSPAVQYSTFNGNVYRTYSGTHNTVGVSAGSHVYVSGPSFGGLVDLGDFGQWAAQAGCPAITPSYPSVWGTYSFRYFNGTTNSYFISQTGDTLTAQSNTGGLSRTVICNSYYCPPIYPFTASGDVATGKLYNSKGTWSADFTFSDAYGTISITIDFYGKSGKMTVISCSAYNSFYCPNDAGWWTSLTKQ